MGDWATAHPGQTISECATSQENELAEHAGQIAKLETDKVAVDELFPTSVYFPVVEITGMNPGISLDATGSVVLSSINLPFLRKENTPAAASVTVNAKSDLDVVFMDGNNEVYPGSYVSVSGKFEAGYVHLQVHTSISDIPTIAVAKPFFIRLSFSVTVSTTVS